MEGGKGTSNTHEEEANAPIVPGPRARRDRGGVGRVIPAAICQAAPWAGPHAPAFILGGFAMRGN